MLSRKFICGNKIKRHSYIYYLIEFFCIPTARTLWLVCRSIGGGRSTRTVMQTMRVIPRHSRVFLSTFPYFSRNTGHVIWKTSSRMPYYRYPVYHFVRKVSLHIKLYLSGKVFIVGFIFYNVHKIHFTKYSILVKM